MTRQLRVTLDLGNHVKFVYGKESCLCVRQKSCLCVRQACSKINVLN